MAYIDNRNPILDAHPLNMILSPDTLEKIGHCQLYSLILNLVSYSKSDSGNNYLAWLKLMERLKPANDILNRWMDNNETNRE